MIKANLFIIFSLLVHTILIFSANPSYTQMDLNAVYPAVVKIHSNMTNSSGTGVVIKSFSNTCVILTNRHVIWQEGVKNNEVIQQTTVRFVGTNRDFPIKDALYDEEKPDIALLYVETIPGTKVDYLFLSEDHRSRKGARVRVVAYPVKENRAQVYEAEIQDEDEKEYKFGLTSQLTLIAGGESGSPLLDHRGILVGLVRASKREDGNFAIKHSVIREVLKAWLVDIPASPENQQIAIPPLDFDPPNKQREWSDSFINDLKAFFSHSPDIVTVSEGDLSYQYYRRFKVRGSSLNKSDLYRVPSYVLTGWGRKVRKGFQIDLALEQFPGEQATWRKRFEANNLRNLADSVGVYLARYFGYNTKFKGVSYDLRKWSLHIGLAGVLPTAYFLREASSDKDPYRDALTSSAAGDAYSSLHRDEIVRNSAGITTGLSLGFWAYASLINPRKPKFEKLEVK